MIVAQRLVVIGWLLLLVLASGLGTRWLGQPLSAPLSIVHKLASVLMLIFIAMRIVPAFRSFAGRPTLGVAAAIFVPSVAAAFTTGILESIPSQSGALWLNLHRISAVAAAIAAAMMARLLILAAR
ncbi:MAG TPA: hypothetical protein VME23_14990 [Terracidiphilus sp.]|nr:hypothetical protein [Terracidiphilus sp.]